MTRVQVFPEVSTPKVLRLALALSVLAMLLADVWRVPHLLFVPHRVCGEHGELIHGHGNGETAAESLPSKTAAALPGAPSAHHHAHCTFVAAPGRGGHALAVARVGGVAEAPPATSSVLFVPAERIEALECVLSYAPKQSPPASGASRV